MARRSDRARGPSDLSRQGVSTGGADPSREVHVIDGIAYVLPKYEGRPRWVRKIGRFGVGVSWRWSSFNIGFDILEAGALIAVGPFYLWIAHIERQSTAYAARDMDRSGEAGQTAQQAGPKARAGAEGIAQPQPESSP